MLAKTYFITSSLIKLTYHRRTGRNFKIDGNACISIIFWKYYVIDNLYDMYY